MASLVMTIEDSDPETHNTTQQSEKLYPHKNKKKQLQNQKKEKDKKSAIPTEAEEDIVLNNDFQMLDDIHRHKGEHHSEGNYQNQSKVMWSFQDAVKSKPREHNDDLDQINQEEKVVVTLEEKVKQKLEEYEIDLKEINEMQVIGGEKPQNGDKTENKPIPKSNAKHHYDKEDLISFHQLFLTKPLVKACQDLEYEHPTVIQRKVIPAILEGNDILAHAVTGSGKTAAYLLPILEKYIRLRQMNKNDLGKTRYLILQPTRELAAQCYSMLQSLSKYVKTFSSCLIIGGSNMQQQQRELHTIPDLIVSTTGRLLDHIHNTKGFSLENIEILVLDEADKLVEMGFKDEMLQIVKTCQGQQRQTLMVSATLNQDIKELAQLALKEPLQFTISQQQKIADIASIRLTQYIVRLHEEKLTKSEVDQTKLDKRKKIKEQKYAQAKEEEDEQMDQDDQDLDDENEENDDSQNSENEEDNESDQGSESGSDEEDDKEYEQEFDDDNEGSEKVQSANDDDSDDSDKKRKLARKIKRKAKIIEKKEAKDEILIKREAYLMALVKKHFQSRVIVFFNEKIQVSRMLTLFTAFGLKAAQVHGNMSQEERMESIERFQRGEVDYLLATDLLARGIDISSIKTVINFSFPNEPKRYLHRIGRTARAGSHGVAITICNDEERKEIKKLTRKLGQQVNTYTLQNKIVQKIFDVIYEDLDDIVREIQLELTQDYELQRADMEAKRAENLIRYKDDIMNKPKRHWNTNTEQKKDLKKKSKEDIKNVKANFDQQLDISSKTKKRELKELQKLKQKSKKLEPGQSRFDNDWEDGKDKPEKSENKDPNNNKQGFKGGNKFESNKGNKFEKKRPKTELRHKKGSPYNKPLLDSKENNDQKRQGGTTRKERKYNAQTYGKQVNPEGGEQQTSKQGFKKDYTRNNDNKGGDRENSRGRGGFLGKRDSRSFDSSRGGSRGASRGGFESRGDRASFFTRGSDRGRGGDRGRGFSSRGGERGRGFGGRGGDRGGFRDRSSSRGGFGSRGDRGGFVSRGGDRGHGFGGRGGDRGRGFGGRGGDRGRGFSGRGGDRGRSFGGRGGDRGGFRDRSSSRGSSRGGRGGRGGRGRF